MANKAQIELAIAHLNAQNVPNYSQEEKLFDINRRTLQGVEYQKHSSQLIYAVVQLHYW